MAKEIKVFRLNECEWYAGETAEECIAYAMELTGEPRASIVEDEDSISALSPEAMARYEFLNEAGKKEGSFQQQLDKMIASGETFPCLFACTEC